jgi:hypothetical protein
METKIKITHGAQFKSRNRRDRFLRACTTASTRNSKSVPLLERFPELLHGSAFDPRISFPPVIIKSNGFIRSIANKLMALIVRIKELFTAPGIL